MNELSYLSQIATTKEEAVNFADGIKAQILNGSINPLEAAKTLKAIEEVINFLRKDKEINEAILEKVQQYGKSFEYGGAKFQVKEVGTKYDFTTCKDSEWERLDVEEKRIKEAKKEREKLLKAIPEFKSIVSPDTGEELFAPVKTSTTKVTVSIK